MATPEGRRTILVVDDDAAGRYLLEAILRAHGYDVVEAVDGQDALEKARERAPISSSPTSSCRGWTATSCAWRSRTTPTARRPVLVYTASFGDTADKRFALSLGVDSFMIKPQEAEVILAEAERLLARSPPSRRPSPANEPEMLRSTASASRSKLYQKLLQLERTNTELGETP